jgi:gluconate kinase
VITQFLYKKRTLYLRDQDNWLLAQVEIIKNHMFKLNLMNVQVSCLKACVEDLIVTFMVWTS